MENEENTNENEFEDRLEDALPEELKERLGDVDANTLLLGMLADPDIQAVMSARQANEEIEVSRKKKKEEKKPPKEESKKEEETTDPALKKVMSLIESLVTEKLAPITQDLDSLKGIASNYEETQVSGQINTVKNKYPDFDKHAKSMSKLAKEIPGLGVEEYYILAKSRAKELQISKPSTDSERPTPTARRRGAKNKPTQSRTGRKGWNEILQDGLEKVATESE